MSPAADQRGRRRVEHGGTQDAHPRAAGVAALARRRMAEQHIADEPAAVGEHQPDQLLFVQRDAVASEQLAQLARLN